MDIAGYAIRTPVNTWLMILISLIGGVVALNEIGRLEDPAFVPKEIKIFTQYPGASAEKVEREITEPLEIALQQMPQLDRLSSISKPGLSEIHVVMHQEIDSDELPQVWDELRKHLRDAMPSMPPGTRTPQVFDSFGDVYGLYYALVAPDFSAAEQREFSRIIRRELLSVEGINKVEIDGLRQEEIVAEIDPNRISSLGLSFPDVAQLLNYNLRPFNDGRLLIDGMQVRIPFENNSNRLAELGELPLSVPGSNATVRIKELADLSIQAADRQPHSIRYQGKPAITLAISANTNRNIVEIGAAVSKKIGDITMMLPAGIELHPIYDQGKVVDRAVSGFIVNLLLSIAVVTLTLCIFMGWRSGVVVGASLMLIILATIFCMWLLSMELQRISLGAMIIAMGMLVDNAIVIADGMKQRIQHGSDAITAARAIAARTQWPLLGATIIGFMAFAGIGLSDDDIGEFLNSLFIVIMISLSLSWLIALTVTPLIGSYIYRCNNREGEQQPDLAQRVYLWALHQVLRYRKLSLVGALFITLGAYAGFGLIKQGFFPAAETPVFYIHYHGEQTRDIRETEKKIYQAEQWLLNSVDEVVAVSTFIGRGAQRFVLSFVPETSNERYGLFVVQVKSHRDINRIRNRIIDSLQRMDPQAQILVKRMVYSPTTDASIEARFSGPDKDQLREIAAQALAIFERDPAMHSQRHNWREKALTLTPVYDSITAGIAGVSRADFSDALLFASSGLQLGTLRDGDYNYPIIARHPNAQSNTSEALINSQVWSAQQRRYIPMRQVMKELKLGSEDTLIHRRDRLRTITVMGEPGWDETVAEALQRIRPQIEAMPLPQGYSLEWGGEYESSRDAQLALGKGLPLSFLAMLFISIILFGKVRQPLIIWLITPMALVGVVFGLLLADMPFGFMSLLGLLSLFGLLIKNAIVLIEEIDLQIAEGIAPNKALVDASLSRLQPVAMGAVTTIMGMTPLLIEPFFADMAVTIMGGLAFATVLTLLVVPLLYSLFFAITVDSQDRVAGARH